MGTRISPTFVLGVTDSLDKIGKSEGGIGKRVYNMHRRLACDIMPTRRTELYSPFALCIVVYRRILKEVHLIKRWAGATAADVVSIVFYGGCNWESWIEKPEQPPRLLLVRGGGAIFMGATCLYPHTGPFDMKFMQNDRRHFLAFDTPHVGTDTEAHGVPLSSHAQRLFSLWIFCGEEKGK